MAGIPGGGEVKKMKGERVKEEVFQTVPREGNHDAI